eukprot:364305-Chlamydomonas_euryale.AAC.4
MALDSGPQPQRTGQWSTAPLRTAATHRAEGTARHGRFFIPWLTAPERTFRCRTNVEDVVGWLSEGSISANSVHAMQTAMRNCRHCPTMHRFCPTMHRFCPTMHRLCPTMYRFCPTMYRFCPTMYRFCPTMHRFCPTMYRLRLLIELAS